MQVAEKEIDRFPPQEGGRRWLFSHAFWEDRASLNGNGKRERGEDNKGVDWYLCTGDLIRDRDMDQNGDSSQWIDNTVFQGQEAGGFIMFNSNIM